MHKHTQKTMLFALVLLSGLSALHAQAFVDIEGGAAFTGYNDVSIPAESGSRISLKDDTASDPALALRVRAGFTFAGRHTVTALAAPLNVRGSAVIDRDLSYQGVTFAAGTRVDSLYRFDSYRLTYRYSFINTDSLVMAAGLTGKIRFRAGGRRPAGRAVPVLPECGPPPRVPRSGRGFRRRGERLHLRPVSLYYRRGYG